MSYMGCIATEVQMYFLSVARTIFSMDFPENIMRPSRFLMSFIFASGAACTIVSITVSLGSSASDCSNQVIPQKISQQPDHMCREVASQLLDAHWYTTPPFNVHSSE